MDAAQRGIAELPRDRLVREAIRAHEALMQYGRHGLDCPADGNDEVEATGNCDCGLDAATYSPFVPEQAEHHAPVIRFEDTTQQDPQTGLLHASCRSCHREVVRVDGRWWHLLTA